MFKRSSALAIGMAAALAACGSKDSTKTISSALDFCTSANAAMTEGYAKCASWSPAAVAAEKAMNAETCKGADKEVAAKLISYDAGKGTACVKALQALTDCSMIHHCRNSDLDEIAKLVPECSGVVVAVVKAGGSCYDDFECESDACDQSNNACPGTCKAAVTEGSDCSQNQPCAKGQHCYYEFNNVGTLISATCKAYATSGQSCASNSCADGLDCDRSSATPTCVAEKGVGESCASVDCQYGLYCDASTQLCAKPLTSGDCQSAKCAEGYRCVSSGPTSATCQKIGGLGDACTPGQGTCGTGYYCGSTSTCANVPAVGEDCDSGSSASEKRCLWNESYCDAATQKCTAFKALGAACDPMMSADECGYLATCDGATMTCKAYDTCVTP